MPSFGSEIRAFLRLSPSGLGSQGWLRALPGNPFCGHRVRAALTARAGQRSSALEIMFCLSEHPGVFVFVLVLFGFFSPQIVVKNLYVSHGALKRKQKRFRYLQVGAF